MFSFGLRVASAREWTEAGIRLVTTRLFGRAPSWVGDQGALGWSPCGRQRWQRMVDEPLTDWTRWCRPGRLYLLVVRSSHEDLPHLQRGLALVGPVARKPAWTFSPILKDRRQARG